MKNKQQAFFNLPFSENRPSAPRKRTALKPFQSFARMNQRRAHDNFARFFHACAHYLSAAERKIRALLVSFRVHTLPRLSGIEQSTEYLFQNLSTSIAEPSARIRLSNS